MRPGLRGAGSLDAPLICGACNTQPEGLLTTV